VIAYFRSLSGLTVRSFLLIGLFFASTLRAQTPVVLLTDAADLRSSVDLLPALRRAGMEVRVVAGPGAFIGTLNADGNASTTALRAFGILHEARTRSTYTSEAPAHRLALRYLDELQAGRFDLDPTRHPMDWSGHPEHLLEVPDDASFHDADPSRSNATLPPDWTCTNDNNSEYLRGVVCASVFFIESNGSIDANTYSWSASDITNVELQMIDAWSIWSHTASLHGATVTAVMDFREPAGGIPVQGYEPITRSSSQDGLWIDAIMTNAGMTASGAFAKCRQYNAQQRVALTADQAFCAFIAYNPSGAPTQFTDGKIGYAYLGGPYTQLLFKANGWSTSDVGRVYAHETGHIFHAFDEYSASGIGNCTRNFNGRQNANYQGSTCNGTAACVMINNSFSGSGSTRSWNLCSHTPYHLGWSGMLTPPTCTSPINDVVVTANPVVLRWNRQGAPASAYGYAKVFDRNSGAQVFCGYTGQLDSAALNLLNGQYRWTISQGNASVTTGYAGVIGTEGLFTVNAPLNAGFSRTPALICAGATVTYTNTSTGAPTSWNWSFPGGTPSTWNGVAPPAIHYALPGNYNASLTVGDGTGTHAATMINAVTATGGAALPFAESFSGSFPPTGWTSYAGGGQTGGVSWTQDLAAGCSGGSAAFVNAYDMTGSAAGPQIGTPRVDLSAATLPYLRFRYSYAQESSTETEAFQVYAHNCSYQVYQTLLQRNGAALATNGGAYVTGQGWQPATCDQWREVILRTDALAGHIGQFWFYLNTQGGQNMILDDISVFDGVRIKVKALLQGPFDAGTLLMNDGLRAAGLVPLQEPYSEPGYKYVDEGVDRLLSASVLSATGPDAIADWVVLELRDPTEPTKIRYSRPALLQRDGDVVDLNGTSFPRIGLPAGNYHVSILHRNHLGVMTAAPISVNNSMITLDLSDPVTPTWGTDARYVVSGKALLWAGNARADGTVRYTGQNNDRDPILVVVGSTTPNGNVVGYRAEDINLDGNVRYTGGGNDRDIILINVGSTTPNNSRVQQVP
jgi:PKD repeat protein